VAALAAGLVAGAALFAATVVADLFAIHFLYIPPLLFVFSLLVLIVVSRRGEPRPDVEALMWRPGGAGREPSSQPALRWYADFRVQALLLLLATACVVVMFA